MSIVSIRNLVYEYQEYSDSEEGGNSIRALDGVSLDIEEGSFVAVLGHNGSGKSTLAKHVNALLLPTFGEVYVLERNTLEETDLWKIRKDAGMIFQNPDNQIIGNSIEEDIAFGPENIGVATDEIEKRITFALEKTGLEAYRYHSPNRLSGGQKQRVGIAGMLAMLPKVILMDEPTAMLDPVGRKEVLTTVHELNKEMGITVVLITHYMEEAADADRVIVMDKGKIVMDGTPREIFSRVDELHKYHLTVPDVTALAEELRAAGVPLEPGILRTEELVDALCRLN